MSNDRSINYVFSSPWRTREKIVLLCIYWHRMDDPWSDRMDDPWSERDRIAMLTGLSTAAVERSIDKLIKMEVLKVTK